MGYDYALVHVKYTIPPALLLSLLYYPLATRVGLYKIAFLVFVAVTATIPWDSYLIRTRIWTYPVNAIVGPTLYDIPAEEVFFFVVQTLITSLLYLLLSKPTFHPVYLRGSTGSRWLQGAKWTGIVGLAAAIIVGGVLVFVGGRGLYLGLIVVWAGPFALLLWSLAHQLLITLPWSNTLLPIAVPTIYLWIIDTLALRRGTWAITSGTKLGWHLWTGLEIEEAVFFVATNVMIVFGLVAFDNAAAIVHTFGGSSLSPLALLRALVMPVRQYDELRIQGLQEALRRLRAKSRSFYLASGFFDGQLRIDLVLLYSFCRMADDLVDEARSVDEARAYIRELRTYLDLKYANSPKVDAQIATFPDFAHSALKLLPTDKMSSAPLFDLLRGFEMDLAFGRSFPIANESALETYGTRVAGTVAELCIQLAYRHAESDVVEDVVEAGGRMGVALQYINIARDIAVDADNGRVYLPTDWLKEQGMVPEDVLKSSRPRIDRLRQRLLDRAMHIYNESRPAIERLPERTRAPMRVAVESYVEIGRVLQEPEYTVKAGRATVPRLRRLQVAWRALS